MRESSNSLLRVLGLAFGLAMIVGGVIGQGILRSPGIVAEATSSPAIYLGLWAFGAFLALIVAMPLAELGAAIPRAGGIYAIVARAFGEQAGVLTALVMLVLGVSTHAMLMFVLGEFLVRAGVGGGALSPGVLGLIAIIGMFALQATGTRLNGAFQIVLSSLKGGFLLVLVALFFIEPGAAAPAAVDLPALAGWSAFSIAILVIISTYNGWGDIVFFGEEFKDPGRQVPRALFGGIVGVATIYLLVNLALIHVLSLPGMAGSNFAAADAAGRAFGPAGDLLLTAFGLLSVGAIAMLSTLINARYVFGAARAGILPRWIAKVSRKGSPNLAAATACAASAAFLLSGSYLALSATSVSLGQLAYVAVTLAFFRLRASEPDLPRPWRMPLYPMPAVIALVLNVGLLGLFVVEDPFNTVLGFALVAALWAGYWIFSRGRSNLAELSRIEAET